VVLLLGVAATQDVCLAALLLLVVLLACLVLLLWLVRLPRMPAHQT
jgi:ABC-type transporter Mla subunit MlaD